MIKAITKIGNSQGIIFDSALMELAHLKVGDEVTLSYHEGGSIVLTPIQPRISKEVVSGVIEKTMKDYAKTMKKLA
jgi:antitoxin component of MazEF toxin-antitoxin module